MPVSTLCVTLNHSCLFFTSFKLLLCQSQTRWGQQMVSTFKMQEAALRSGKTLLLPMTASLPSTLPLFLSYRVCLCSFEDACQNVLQPTIKILFFSQSYPVFQLFNCKNTIAPIAPCSKSPHVHACTHFSYNFAGSRSWRNVLMLLILNVLLH